MGLPPFSLALAGKTGPATMISSAVEDVNAESYGSLLYELVLDPLPYGGERIEKPPADVDARQTVKPFEVLDHIARIGSMAHGMDSQEVQQSRLGYEFRKANLTEFFIHDDLPDDCS
jgi:hypothetical protein